MLPQTFGALRSNPDDFPGRFLLTRRHPRVAHLKQEERSVSDFLDLDCRSFRDRGLAGTGVAGPFPCCPSTPSQTTCAATNAQQKGRLSSVSWSGIFPRLRFCMLLACSRAPAWHLRKGDFVLDHPLCEPPPCFLLVLFLEDRCNVILSASRARHSIFQSPNAISAMEPSHLGWIFEISSVQAQLVLCVVIYSDKLFHLKVMRAVSWLLGTIRECFTHEATCRTYRVERCRPLLLCPIVRRRRNFFHFVIESDVQHLMLPLSNLLLL